ncbi:YggS family pyridoxal phosphate-dependent enzyme [Aureimonas fodinaquatilis]|uniref:Pyridoxal phosphate homeostasis protein n=1 Tax=Aureimonas fodinaquatilis TaxID=2565783 RepID=A0A5B0DP52_9HYPH|nr:YggS family pyridoxal phosphate-dependent enzyme [Aureimonas fodinaquatilis]KAA0968236.1 YggS family pyridoxal phosphate-dependent enzyme [Aureimonas fodinaquatilis]
MNVTARYESVKADIANAELAAGRNPGSTRLVAVSKTYPADAVLPLLHAGHRHFGENRVQEAASKFPALRSEFPDLALHLIGPLQSNKAADAVALFDVIETVDREKIARELAREMDRQQKWPELYVQVNTGNEAQKAGILPDEAVAFVARCRLEHGLTISGLMCIPPVDEQAGPHFDLLRKLAGEAGVDVISMGMSGDYEIAVAHGATSVRVGSAIFGVRS